MMLALPAPAGQAAACLRRLW